MVLRRSHLQGSKGSNRSNYQSDVWHRVHGSMPLRRGTWLLSDRKHRVAPHPPSLHRSKEPLDRREQRAKLYWRRNAKSSICVHDGEPLKVADFQSDDLLGPERTLTLSTKSGIAVSTEDERPLAVTNRMHL